MDPVKTAPVIAGVRREGDWTVAGLRGAIDYNRSGEMAVELDRIAAAGPHILLDLAAVEYLDTTGLATLVALRNRLAEAGGQMVLCRVPERVRGLIEVSHLRSIFDIVADEADVLAAGHRTEAR